MNYLCVCEGGNVRSVTLAYILKQERGLNALACSWRFNDAETLSMLYEWANKIIVMQANMKDKIPEEYQSKTEVCDVGPDRWGRSLDSDLGNVIRDKLNEDMFI